MSRRDNKNDYYNNTNDRQGGRRNNFDNMYDANQYGCNDNNNFGRGQQQPPQQNYPPNGGDYQPMGTQPFRERFNNMHEQPMRQSNVAMEQIQSAVTASAAGTNNVIIMSPKNYVDVKHLIDSLRLKQAIVVDLIEIDEQDGQRVLDFLSGAIYALGGSMQRITASIFVFTPGGVSIQLPFDIINKK